MDAILNIGTTRRESVHENDTDLVYKGLETAYDSVFLSSRGDRADAPNYYIYTTDYIFPEDDPYTTGLNIRITGDSYIWAVGVKSAVTQAALVQSVGSDGRYYTGSSFQTLNTVDHAKEFWELFRGCPLIDPSAGIYCEFLKHYYYIVTAKCSYCFICCCKICTPVEIRLLCRSNPLVCFRLFFSSTSLL